jgi:hypothetical protein
VSPHTTAGADTDTEPTLIIEHHSRRYLSLLSPPRFGLSIPIDRESFRPNSTTLYNPDAVGQQVIKDEHIEPARLSHYFVLVSPDFERRDTSTTPRPVSPDRFSLDWTPGIWFYGIESNPLNLSITPFEPVSGQNPRLYPSPIESRRPSTHLVFVDDLGRGASSTETNS